MEYKKVKLKEVCTVNQGLQIPISKRFKEKGPNRYFYITIQFLKGNTDEYYIENPKKSVICQKEDILVVRTGNTGMVLTGVEGCFHNNFFKVEPNEKIYSKYLYYTLNNKYMYKEMLNAASGTTIPDLKHSAFYDLVIPLPTLSLQHKIVNVLESIDKKIELNNKINDNLLELIKTLYIEKIKNNNEAIFEDKTLDEFCNVFTGKKNANASEENGKYKFFTCAPEPLNINTYIYDGPVVIVAGNGAYTGRTNFYNGKFDLYQRTYGITTNNDYIYLFYAMIYTDLQNDIMGGTHGSAIPYIVMNDIAKFKVKYNKEIFDELSEKIKSLLLKIKNNELENETLTNLRDTLLPKLMNGEIDLDKIEI